MLADFLLLRESIPSLNIQPIVYTGTGVARTMVTGVNLATGGAVMVRRRDAAEPVAVFDTVRGMSKRVRFGTPNEDILSTLTVGDRVVTLLGGNYNVLDVPYVAWLLRKVPGFFTVVPFTGTGATSYAHDLGSTPGTGFLFQRTGPTPGGIVSVISQFSSTQFSVGVAPGDTYLALLFGNDSVRAKCGTYTGEGEEM